MSSSTSITSHSFPSPQGSFHYLLAGPSSGPLLILIHGWPGLALTWRPQLLHFASLGYHVAAMDTLGYGQSPRPTHDVSLYSSESLAADQLLLLAHLQRSSAIWVGHDWGCGALWALAGHYPEKCEAIVSLCLPYRTIDLGVQHLITLANREIYPREEYPNAQLDYMIAYEQNSEAISKQFAEANDKITKLMFSRANKANYRKVAITAGVVKRGGWFGTTVDEVPDMPLGMSVLDEELYEALRSSLGRDDGWRCATMYYLNHERNAEYNKMENLKVKDGVLEMPVLFVDAKYDIVCSADQNPAMLVEQRRLCRDLREEVVETGHWANLEKADEVNGYMEDFLKSKGLVPVNGSGKL
jgi:soluble epoxide hydrolase / lipid-phosphate phosphatase